MSTYFPKHEENRMKNKGDVESARRYFKAGKNRVLYRLIGEGSVRIIKEIAVGIYVLLEQLARLDALIANILA